jgi:hypothetical protein
VLMKGERREMGNGWEKAADFNCETLKRSPYPGYFDR